MFEIIQIGWLFDVAVNALVCGSDSDKKTINSSEESCVLKPAAPTIKS